MSTLTQFFSAGGGGSAVPAYQGGPVADGITVAEVLLVGGGGSGGNAPLLAQGCNGGTSGEVIYSTAIFFTQGTSYTITIGAAATDSSIVGGSLNFYAEGGHPGPTAVRGHRNCRLDEYTTSFGFPGSRTYVDPDVYTHPTPLCGGGALQPARGNEQFGAAKSGGEGISFNITGSFETYGSGGGGLNLNGGTNAGRGGAPGGNNGIAGTANTGSGGGGASYPGTFNVGGAGGSGICVIRWPTAFRDAPSVSGNTPTPAQPGYYVYRWNSGPGSITF